MKGHPETDPKGLVFESYRMDGISEAECRTIFLDWALSLPDGADTMSVLGRLIAQYEPDFPDHPMTGVLRAGQTQMATPKRRGGWRSRPRD